MWGGGGRVVWCGVAWPGVEWFDVAWCSVDLGKGLCCRLK